MIKREEFKYFDDESAIVETSATVTFELQKSRKMCNHLNGRFENLCVFVTYKCYYYP